MFLGKEAGRERKRKEAWGKRTARIVFVTISLRESEREGIWIEQI